MKFSVLHPTARVTPDFEHPWWKAFESALNGADSPADLEYIVIVHRSRIGMFYAHLDVMVHPGRFLVVVNYGRDCLVDQCNAGQLAMTGEILVGNQDDMRYPEHWDTEIAKLIPDTSQFVCVQAKTDGNRRDLLTIPTIATKAFLDRMGPISPEYDGMFSDNEFSDRARRDGTVIQSDLYFPHLHPAYETGDGDSVHAMENREEAYRIGQEVYLRRKAQGFPRVELPGFERRPDALGRGTGIVVRAEDASPAPQISERWYTRAADWLERRLQGAPKAAPQRKLMACLPTRNLDEVGNVLQLASAAAAMGFQFDAFPGYTSSPDVTRIALAEAVLKEPRGDFSMPYVFWKDEDNLVTPEQLVRLVTFLDRTPGCDIIVGWCWIKQAGGSWSSSVGRFDRNMHVIFLTPPQFREDGTDPKRIERMASGFPCVLMRREVLDRLGPRAFVKIQRDDFSHGGMGEDFSFFWRAHEAGMHCYIDPLCKVEHIKPERQEPHLSIPQEMWTAPDGRLEEASMT